MRTTLLAKTIRTGALSVLLALLGLTSWKVVTDLRRPEHRGLLVVDMLEDQVRSARTGLDIRELFRGLMAQSDLKPDCDLLRRWMVAWALNGASPSEIRHELEKLVHTHRVPRELHNSIDRWRLALLKWESQESAGRNPMPQEKVLCEAKKRLHEAEGFRRIGRGYDATVYYVWSFQLLRRFLGHSSGENELRRFPEALLYAGVAWKRIGEALPDGIRFERALHMLAELFPDSVWGIRANEQWNLKGGSEGV